MRSGRLVWSVIVPALLYACHGWAAAPPVEALPIAPAVGFSVGWDGREAEDTESNSVDFEKVGAFVNKLVGFRLFDVESSDPNKRILELLNNSEDLRQIEYEWEQIWFVDQPSPLVPDRVEGGRETDKPAVGVPARIATDWQNNIVRTDFNPALAGRLYLFGTVVGDQIAGDGSVVVEMFDESEDGESIKREQWEIDAQTLQRVMHLDRIGWGYTLFLPSAEYKPEMSKLRMMHLATRRPGHGNPVYADSVVTLGTSPNATVESSKPLPGKAKEEPKREPSAQPLKGSYIPSLR